MPPSPSIEKSSSLRFGVMCNGTVFQRWQAEAMKELRQHGHHLVLLIIDARKTPESSRFRRMMKKKMGTFLFSFLDNRLFKPAAKQPVDLSPELNGIPSLSCLVVKKGYSEYFEDADVSAIRHNGLDFILRFGFSIIRGNILSAARFGVWSFHHDDEMIYRGGPPGFWEIYRGDPVSGAILQRLTDKLDGGTVLHKGYLKTTAHSYCENLQQLLAVSSAWPARVADQLCLNPAAFDHTAVHSSPAASQTTAPVYKVPGNLQMMKFLCLLLQNRIRFYYRDLFAAEIWNVGIIMKAIDEIATGGALTETDVTWLPAVAHQGYLADPAGFMEQGKLHILAEDYSYATQKAGISEFVMEADQGKLLNSDITETTKKVIEEISHLSYPFVFEYNDQVYCVPESFRSRQITLYRRDSATGKFLKDHVLLYNILAVDPTLFFYNGRWWLFFTARAHSNTHLYIYHSEELSGTFKPHRLNPVKTDIRSARPAGTPFVYNNALYRPAQDCSLTYGGRVAINRVLTLTPDDFSEETVRFIDPVKESKYSQGLHTISSVGHFTLIDGKRYQLNHRFFIHRLMGKISRKERGNV